MTTNLASGKNKRNNISQDLASTVVTSTPMQLATLQFAIELAPAAMPQAESKLTWQNNAPFLQMLGDLLRASGAELSENPDGMLVATLPSPIHALVAARRAQKLAAGFAHQTVDSVRCLAILIDMAVTRQQPQDQTLRVFLRSAGQTGQILLSGPIYKELQTLPGLGTRKLSDPAQNAERRADLYEFMVAAEDRPAAPSPASLIAPPKPKEVVLPELASPMVPVLPPLPIVREAVPLVKPLAEKIQTAPESAASLRHRKEEQANSPAPPRRGIMFAIISVAAVVVLGAAITWFMRGGAADSHPVLPAASTTATPEKLAEPAATSPSPSHPAASSDTPAVKLKTLAIISPPVADTAKAVAGPLIATPVPAKPIAAEPVAVAPPVVQEAPAATPSGTGYTAEQIKAILDKADMLTENAKYDDAIRNYNVVLARDPKNSRAIAGKARAISNKSLR